MAWPTPAPVRGPDEQDRAGCDHGEGGDQGGEWEQVEHDAKDRTDAPGSDRVTYSSAGRRGCPGPYAVTLSAATRASGGIGRRAGFRFLCPQGREGSSP
ncbi:MAG: hypothetical protein QGI29_06675, partial [Pirellulales bacterium]|nr:hypothetical protein [Pirellulales bacterium]